MHEILFGGLDFGTSGARISIINKKMTPIICVGETLEEKNNKNTKTFIKRQSYKSTLSLSYCVNIKLVV